MSKDTNQQITGSAIDAYQQMDGDLQRDIDQFLEANPRQQLYCREDLVRAWLTWNGIIGYTPVIVRLVLQAHKGRPS